MDEIWSLILIVAFSLLCIGWVVRLWIRPIRAMPLKAVIQTLLLFAIDCVFIFCLINFSWAIVSPYILTQGTATGAQFIGSMIFGLGSFVFGLLGFALQGILNDGRKRLIDVIFSSLYLLSVILLLISSIL